MEDIRKNKKELEDYIMETHVRKAQVDFYMQFRQKGLSAQEIQDIFSSDAYQKLFDRIRTNPSLRKRTQAYLTKLLAPYYLEDRVIAKHIELSQKFHELVSEEYEAQVLAYQRKIRQIKTPPPEKLGFWAKMTKKIKEHFLGT